MLSDEGSRKFKKLQQAYRASLNTKRKELKECWQFVHENDWSQESLNRFKLHVHRLAGSAAPYGFETISEASSELEQLVIDFLVGDSTATQRNAIRAQITERFGVLTETLTQENTIEL